MEEINVLEVLMSAKFNLETFAKQNPQVMSHPSFVIAKSQIDNCVAQLEKEQDQD